MDQEQLVKAQQRGSIPQLSRLPLPRASRENLKHGHSIGRQIAKRTSAIPLAFDVFKSKSPQPQPLGEHRNDITRSRYQWTPASTVRQLSPVRSALARTETSSLETTPPEADPKRPLIEDGNENATIGGKLFLGEPDERRRPRPSLSERTIETLSQLSPSPSSSRRSSMLTHDGTMRPPSRPASALKNLKPDINSVNRPASPAKRPFLPPGKSSPAKAMLSLPAVPSPNSLYEPPRAFVRDKSSKIGKTLRERRSFSNLVSESLPSETRATTQHHREAKTLKSRPLHDAKTLRSTQSKPSLASLFKDLPDLPKQAVKDQKLAIGSLKDTSAQPRVAENTLAARTPRPRCVAKPLPRQQDNSVGTQTSTPVKPGKSSDALHQAMAMAKASAIKPTAASATAMKSGEGMVSVWSDSLDDTEGSVSQSTSAVLRARCNEAATTGILNIANLDLKDLSQEVLSIYDFDLNSRTSWAEAVDLRHFDASGNELQELSAATFPDWTQEEMLNDDDKSNQFGGLEHLDLHSNMLKTLPIGIRALGRLEVLDLKNNQLTFNSISVLFEMKCLLSLDLSKNCLTGDMPDQFGSLETLRTLRLANNAITSISALRTLKSLCVLELGGNSLSTLPKDILSSLSLSQLGLARNKLQGILFEQDTFIDSRLKFLDLSDNALELFSIRPVRLSCLETLSLNRNRLTNLPDLSQCQGLITITARDNNIKDIPLSLRQACSLTTLDISGNCITTVPPELATMRTLTNLRLQQNPLRNKKYLTMDTEEIKLALEKLLPEPSPLTNLQKPEESPLSREQSTITEQTPTPETARNKSINGTLDLSSQALTKISPDHIMFTEAIHTVNLSNNDLTTFPHQLLSHPSIKYSLRNLNLSHNPCLDTTTYLHQELFLPSLESLCIVSTGLTSLDALTNNLKAPSLQTLNISCHRLTGHVPWVRAWYPSVTTLLATDNWFTSIDVEAVRGLEVLDVRNNEIGELPAGIGLLGVSERMGDGKEKEMKGKLKVLEVSGNAFDMPDVGVVEKGTEFVLRALRKMIAAEEMPEDWQ